MANNDGTLKFDTKIDSSGFQKGLDSIGGVTTKVLGAAATGITALGGAAIKVGSDFEAGMSEVQAIVGTVADKDLPGIIDTAKEMGLSFKEGASTTETAMNILSEKAKEMGASTKFSATESAEALNYMAMAGWKTEDMLGGIEGIMNLAAASGEDLAMTSNIVTDALTAFGMTAADSTHFADVLAAASSNANTNVSEMGEAFKYVAPVAGALNYSIEDVSTAIGLMSNGSVHASQAGTALRAVLTRLAKPTKESETAMNALGLSITDSSGKMKPLNEVVRDMRKGFAGLTEDEKANYAAMLGGQEAMAGLLNIVNASDADFEKLSGAINDCNGSAAEMAEIMQDNLHGQLDSLQAKLEGLGISLYETMQDTAKDVVKEAQGMVQQLQDAFNEGGFDGLVSEVGNVLSQILERIASSAPELIAMVVSLVHSFCEGIKSSDGIGEAGASLIMALAEGMISMSGDLISTAGVLILQLVEGIANSLPALIEQAAVIINDFALALVDNLPILVDVALQLVMGIVQGFIDAMPVLLEGAIQLFMAILEALPVVIEQLLQALPDIIITITDYLTENTPMIVDGAFQMLMGIIEAIPQIIEALVEATPEIVSAIVDSIVRQGAALVEAGSKIIGWLIEGASSVWGSITDWFAGAVQNLINSIVTFFEELPYKIGYAIGNIIGTLVDWNNSVNEWIVTEVPRIIDNIIEWFKGLPDRIAEWFNQTIDNLTPWGTSFKESSGQKVDEICIGIIEGFKELPDKLIEIGGNLISGLIEGIAGKTQDLWNSVTDFCGGIVDGFKDALGIHSPSTVMEEQAGYLVDGVINGIANMPAELAQYLDETVARVLAWGQQMYADVQSAVQNMVDTAVETISLLPDKMWTWLVNTITKMLAWGQQMLASAKTAVSNMISAIISQLAQLPGKVTAELAKVTAGMVQWGADIVSKMTEVGKNIVSGIWNGISSGWDWLTGKVAELANSLLESAKGALGINSPSTEFRDEFGRWLMPGAVEGVKRSMPRALQDMKEQAGELLAAMKGAVDTSMSEISMNAYGSMGARALTTAGTVVQIDNSQKQENNYHEKVISPSEVAKNQREAFRNFQKGVK